MYKYFVSYACQGEGGFSVGSVELSTNGPINCIEHVREMEYILRNQLDFDSLVIINYILLNQTED